MVDPSVRSNFDTSPGSLVTYVQKKSSHVKYIVNFITLRLIFTSVEGLKSLD